MPFATRRRPPLHLKATFREERKLRAAGCQLIAGVDEVGRGAWAGPVVAAAVAFDSCDPGLVRKLKGVCDSKMLTHEQRVRLDRVIRRHATAIAIAGVPHHVIDEINIYQATKVAMQMAVAYLPYKPDHLLIDAVRLTELDLPQKPIIHGDALSLSIAAASIVAKVYRDRIMMGLHFQFPEYSFFTNKGYGTMAHFRAINAHGLLPLHRRSFIPMKYLVRHDTEALSTYRKMLLLKQEAEEEADAALA